jgi:hypothetical protein
VYAGTAGSLALAASASLDPSSAKRKIKSGLLLALSTESPRSAEGSKSGSEGDCGSPYGHGKKAGGPATPRTKQQAVLRALESRERAGSRELAVCG